MNRLAVVASIVLAPAIALADGTEAPSVCASCVVAPAPQRPVDLQHRIGVTARAVSFSVADADGNKSEYGGGGFAVSYRLSRRWELAVALDALDAPEGPDLHAGMLEARFHINPFHRWDWYALAGIGAVHEAPLEGESHQDMPSRGRVDVGVGLSRRFPRWSLAAEIHAVGLGPLETPTAMDAGTAMKETPMTAKDDGLSGGQATIAATFYF